MIEWLRDRRDSICRPLIERYPDLYLLHLQDLFAIVIVLVAVATVAGTLRGVTAAAVPDEGANLLLGLCGSVVIGIVWGLFFARERQAFWPTSRVRRYSLLLVGIICFQAIALPPIVYVRLQFRQTVSLARRIGTDHLSHSLALAASAAYPDGGDSDASLPATRFRKWRELEADRVLNLSSHCATNENDIENACLENVRANLSRLSSALDAPDSFKRDVVVASCWSGAVLGLVLALRETSLWLELVTTACCLGYSVIGIATVRLFGYEPERVIGVFLVVHWLVVSLMAFVQWCYRASGLCARATSVLVALLTPWIVPSFSTMIHVWQHDEDLPAIAIASYIVYIVLFPFVDGNFVRLRVYPRP